MKKKRPRSDRPKQSKPPQSRADRWSGGARTPEGKWFISGLNGVTECLASPHVTIKTIWASPSKLTRELWALLGPHKPILEELRGRETPYGPAVQGIAALVEPPRWPEADDLLDAINDQGKTPFLVALDQVEDPMNLGQILRTCEGAGVDAVFLLKHRSVHMNQTVAQVSQGAFAWVPVIELTNLRNSLEHLKERGIWVIGCESGPGSISWNQCGLREPLTLVFGAEGRGLRELTRKTCDQLASLPMNGRINSLNVGAATSAFLYEVVRQRRETSQSDAPQP